MTREIVVSGTTGWKRKIRRRQEDGLDFYRSAKSTLATRCRKKLLEKANWFKAKRKREDDHQEERRASPKKRIRLGHQDKDQEQIRDKNKDNNNSMKENVKAVMFVPFTEGSALAKRMREAESSLQDMTGYRLKIVERAGTKLEDILTKADPWQGQDCGRPMCLLCQTKQRTGKHTSQDCTRRSVVYESWCLTCQEKDIKTAEEQADGDPAKLKQLKEKIKLSKYVGETSRSVYERGFEHLSDYQNLSTKSHMLKHKVEKHPEEELDNIKFGICIIKTAKSSFSRQIYESVLIQASRSHHLLNSRSEYNRFAVPRLICKLGDGAYKKFEKETALEVAKEEIQILKIRELVKERNRRRHQTRAPPPKRRKTGSETYTCEKDQQECSPKKQPEKRKPEESSTRDQIKKPRTGDIRELFQEKTKEKEPEPQLEPELENQKRKGVY